jgi:gamma-glutamyl:cysteine ligase YbdK (ATP-grasp superfamily)
VLVLATIRPHIKLTVIEERIMDTVAHTIEKRIAALRELIRCTLDRSKHPAMRATLLEEIVKLKAYTGVKD